MNATTLEGSMDRASSTRWVVRSPSVNAINGRGKGDISAAEIKAAKDRARVMLERLARSLDRAGVSKI